MRLCIVVVIVVRRVWVIVSTSVIVVNVVSVSESKVVTYPVTDVVKTSILVAVFSKVMKEV